MTVRKLQGAARNLEIAAKATAAVTGNPTAGTVGGGLFCTLDTDPNFFVLSSAGDDPDGILSCNALINSVQTLRQWPMQQIKLGGTVAAKGYVQCGAAGVAVAATGLAPIVGQVLQAGVTGDFVDILYGKQPRIGQTGAGNVFGAMKGADVASATAIVPTGNVFHVTGTTSITSITSTNISSGARITLIFDGILTFTAGNNLKIAGNMTTSALDTITLVYDGTNWFEVARSVNA